MTWAIMPVLNNWPMTEQAAYDLLGQSVPTQLLIAAQGVDEPLRAHLEKLSEKFPDRVFCLFWNPPIPSLSGVWNRCLRMVWSLGEQEALVVNNDTRTHPQTLEILSQVLHGAEALFVSGVGVTHEQFLDADTFVGQEWDAISKTRGGPDFSCFLISKACHQQFPFDENLTPAYLEDLDTHRRIMLAGEGARIFSINLPFLHERSQTLKAMSPARRAEIERQITEGSRAYYEKKWGGPANEEKFYRPFDGEKGRVLPSLHVSCGPTTPELQAYTLLQSTVLGTVRTVQDPA